MATYIIDPDSGAGFDYTSLTAMDAAQARDITAAGTNENVIATCRCTGGTAHGAWTPSSSWVTDATHYLQVWTDPAEGYRFDGAGFPTGNVFRLEGSAAQMIANNGYVKALRLIGLAVKSTRASVFSYGIYQSFTNGDLHVISCMVYYTGGSANGRGMLIYALSAGSAYAVNNVCIDWTEAGIYRQNQSGTYVIYNNTCHGNGTGIAATGTNGTVIARNNLCNGNTTDFDSSTYFDTADSNLSEDTTAPGTNAKTSTAVTFVNEGADDFRLDPTETGKAVNTGADLSGDGNYPFAVDFANTARPQGASWDRGFHEAAAAGVARRVMVIS